MTSPSKPRPPSPWPSAEERTRDRELKRDAVLTAAVQLFNERGYAATSLDDVAAQLGVTKPVIYHYIGAKEQVLFHCLRQGLEQLRCAAERARAEPGTGLDRLRLFLREYALVNMTEFGMCVIRTGDELLSPDSRREFRSLKRETDEALRSLIRDAVADGSIVAEDVRLTAFTLAGALNWIARWYEPGGAMTPQDIAARMVETLLNGLMPRG